MLFFVTPIEIVLDLCYNSYMKSKIVKLKNDLKAKLTIEQMEDYYMLFAKDEANNIVGCCNFSVVLKYTRELSEEKRVAYAKKHKTAIENVPTRIFAEVSPQKVKSYEKVGDGIKIGKNIYYYSSSFCELNKIEITDAKFHRVGLGSKMLDYLIDYVQKLNCDEVKVYVYPFGQFKFSTLEFYKRNGFVYGKHCYATKKINNLKKDHILCD